MQPKIENRHGARTWPDQVRLQEGELICESLEGLRSSGSPRVAPKVPAEGAEAFFAGSGPEFMSACPGVLRALGSSRNPKTG